jgi:hypothetical protein
VTAPRSLLGATCAHAIVPAPPLGQPVRLRGCRRCLPTPQASTLAPMRSWPVCLRGMRNTWRVPLGRTPQPYRPSRLATSTTISRRSRWPLPASMGYHSSRREKPVGSTAAAAVPRPCRASQGVEAMCTLVHGARPCPAPGGSQPPAGLTSPAERCARSDVIAPAPRASRAPGPPQAASPGADDA